jgi:hypothetical protein
MNIIKSYENDQHTRRLLVHRTADFGWDVCEEYDAEVVARTHYADWHRVERARHRFELAAVAAGGWREVRPT